MEAEEESAPVAAVSVGKDDVERVEDEDDEAVGPVVAELCATMGKANFAASIQEELNRRWIDTLSDFVANADRLDFVPEKLKRAVLDRGREKEVAVAKRDSVVRRAREDAATDAEMTEERSQNRIIDRLVALNQGLDNPRFRLIGLTIEELSDLSTADNTVRVDMWVYGHWIEKSFVWGPAGDVDLSKLEWRPTFEIAGALDVRGLNDPADCYYVRERYREHGVVSYFQRFVGTIRVDLDLRQFPFDAQSLCIRLGDSMFGADDVTLVYNTELAGSLWHPVDSVRHLHEFSVFGSPTVTERLIWSTADSRDVSVLDVELQLCRKTSFYVWNVFLIIFLLAMLSLWLFLIEPDVLNDRLQICITVFLALVAVNFVVVESLPKISHTTFLSFFFILNYVSVCFAAIESGVSYLVDQYAGSNEGAKILDWTVMGVYFVFHLSLFVIFLVLSTQRMMLHKLDQRLKSDRDAANAAKSKDKHQP